MISEQLLASLLSTHIASYHNNLLRLRSRVIVHIPSALQQHRDSRQRCSLQRAPQHNWRNWISLCSTSTCAGLLLICHSIVRCTVCKAMSLKGWPTSTQQLLLCSIYRVAPVGDMPGGNTFSRQEMDWLRMPLAGTMYDVQIPSLVFQHITTGGTLAYIHAFTHLHTEYGCVHWSLLHVPIPILFFCHISVLCQMFYSRWFRCISPFRVAVEAHQSRLAGAAKFFVNFFFNSTHITAT